MAGYRSLNNRFEHADVDIYANTLYEIIKNVDKGHKKLLKK
jgi:hypothetical protein